MNQHKGVGEGFLSLGAKPNPKIKIWRMKARVLQSSSNVLEGCYSLPLSSIIPPPLSPMLNKSQVCARLNPFESFCYILLNRGDGGI